MTEYIPGGPNHKFGDRLVAISREEQYDLDFYIAFVECRLTSVEVQDLMMKAYRLGRLHERDNPEL